MLDNIDEFCETIHLEVKNEKTSNKSKENIIQIFPLKSRHLEYVETLKTDFNQHIYNCGGIMDLWVGLSSISIADLFDILNSIGLKLERFVRKVSQAMHSTKLILKSILICVLSAIRTSFHDLVNCIF